jgi:hypothetical protein
MKITKIETHVLAFLDLSLSSKSTPMKASQASEKLTTILERTRELQPERGDSTLLALSGQRHRDMLNHSYGTFLI